MKNFEQEGQRGEQDSQQEAEVQLCMLIEGCMRYDVPFTLEYTTGRSVSFDRAKRYGNTPVHDLPDEVVDQGPKGFTINVGSYSFTNNYDGGDVVFPNLGQAARAGKIIFQEILRGKK